MTCSKGPCNRPCGCVVPVDLMRLVKFVIVGLTGAIVYFLLLWWMVELMTAPVLLATSLAFLFVAIENYALHYGWTFRSSNPHSIAFPKFLFMSVIGFWINWGIMFAGVQHLGLNYLFVQGIAIIAVVSWNFLLTTFWTFRLVK